MKSPLNKRIFREITGELGKYIVIFIFMTALVGVSSGYFISDASLKAAYDESFEKYNIEDGYLELGETADNAEIELIESQDVALYENFCKDVDSKGGSTLRVFPERGEIDLVCLLEGKIPKSGGEIALDRLYMKSNEINLGDTVKAGGEDLKVVGMVALPDYSALYKSISDFMFDTEKFGVGCITNECFKKLPESSIHYVYSWKYSSPPEDRFGKEANELSDDLLKALSGSVKLVNFVPTCRNSAIKFSGDDIGNDRVMMLVMLYMLIAIISFVFAVTTSNTISKEANVIGTLRASGYTKAEIIVHYMAPSLIILLAACLVGNVLGYTLLKEYMAEMYLGSYSLVSYKTLFNADAFIDTTIIPLCILALINFVMLLSKLSLSPLKFLRRDLKRRPKKKAFRLNTKIGIMKRFRMRVLFQNIPGFLTIFVGMFFAFVAMVFSQMFEPLLDNLSRETIDHMLAHHQYILKAPAETKNEDAEKFCVSTLMIHNSDFVEDISVYGIAKGFKKGTIEISDAYADKYRMSEGDEFTLYDRFGDKSYDFTVGNIYEYPGALAVFMDMDDYNEKFGNDKDFFTGYLSDTPIDDIDSRLIAADITQDDLTKTTRQLKRSMGNLMNIFVVLGISVVVLVVYMLAKVIIEKNSQSISLTKILGYSSGEIGRIYIRTTTIVTAASIVLCIPLTAWGIDALWRGMMMSYGGWLAPAVPASAYAKAAALAFTSYLVTAFLLRKKIDRIPLDEALKNVE